MYANILRQTSNCAFSGFTEARNVYVCLCMNYLEEFQFVYGCVRVPGWGLVRVQLCGTGGNTQAARQVQDRGDKSETRRTEEDCWKYSAVIHKVESTTKLHATV